MISVIKTHSFDGYMNGYQQPSVLLTLQINSLNAAQILRLNQAFTYYFAKHTIKINELQSVEDVAAYFGEGFCLLQRLGGLPVFEEVKITRIEGNDHTFMLWVPMSFRICFHQVLTFLINFFNHHFLSSEIFTPSQQISTQMETLIKSLKSHAPQGMNSLRFIKAAHEENIPWKHVALNSFQYGYGASSCWLDSTFSDKTPQISTMLARNKRSMSVMLHNAGFPVPEQYVIGNQAEAIEIARQIGFPVVIKPLDQDGGKGVYANLISEASVKNAYQLASQVSTNLILEKHISGKDYRLLVLNGKLIWAIERTPAGITGDGQNNIQYLAQQHNQRHQEIFPLRYINITVDTVNYLTEQGLTLESVVPVGQFVPLNRIANISTGGTPKGVFDKVHPDNIHLAETAAKLLRLDIAGIDFISPNIEQSYLENNGKLIEINSQPQLGSTTAPHIYRKILTTLLSDNGRIPIIVIFGKSITDNLVQELKSRFFNQHDQVGIAKNNHAYINNEKIMTAPSLFQAGQSLLSLPEINAFIYCIEKLSDIANHGLPFDRYNDLYLTDASLNQQYLNQSDRSAWDTLLKACLGQTINLHTDSDTPDKLLMDKLIIHE